MLFGVDKMSMKRHFNIATWFKHDKCNYVEYIKYIKQTQTFEATQSLKS